MGRPKKDIDYIFGTVMHSKTFGDFIPLYETDILYADDGSMISRMIVIQFIDTGTIATYRLCNVLNGEVKDNFRPNVCGVGYIGNIQPPLDTKIYNLWYDMLRRCFDTSSKEYKYYGAQGVTVCDEWLCFSNFFYSIKNIENFDKWYNGEDYQLDKDFLQNNINKNCRIYSPLTCKFLPRLDNLKLQMQDNAKNNNLRGAIKSHILSDGTQLYESAVDMNGHKYRFGSFYTKEAAARRSNEFYMSNGMPTNKSELSMAQAIIQQHFTKKYPPVPMINGKVVMYDIINDNDLKFDINKFIK